MDGRPRTPSTPHPCHGQPAPNCFDAATMASYARSACGVGISASSAAIWHRRRPRQPARQDPDPCSSSASVVKEEQRRTLGGPVAGAAEEPRRPPGGPVVGAAEEPRRVPGGPDQKPWPLVRVCCSCRFLPLVNAGCSCYGMPKTTLSVACAMLCQSWQIMM
ncbi:hypothetical protein ACQJBY_006195 [Aegilops geniculata]